MTVLESINRRIARHFPHEGLQHRTHSYGSLALVVADLFLCRVIVGRRASYASLHWSLRTQSRKCFLVRWSAALSGVLGVSYSSSGAVHLLLSGSFLFMEQYHFDGNFLASTTPRRRLHFLHLSHSTQVALDEPVVCPKIDPSSSPSTGPPSSVPLSASSSDRPSFSFLIPPPFLFFPFLDLSSSSPSPLCGWGEDMTVPGDLIQDESTTFAPPLLL
mmetsp:Transcript_30597/g.45269  ORF Transcript_30597/g.45269 Transcript_30597/m.45269 type:complete len:217 (-) Transcript_30597:1305-1955(-)